MALNVWEKVGQIGEDIMEHAKTLSDPAITLPEVIQIKVALSDRLFALGVAIDILNSREEK